MNRFGLFVLTLATALALSLTAADPAGPVHWQAGHLRNIDKALPAKVNPALHLSTERLMDSAFILYRDGNSTAEIHDDQADFIVFREGEGAILLGGSIPDAKRTTPGEQRGEAIVGGARHPMAAGDMIYVPANTPHQFLVDPGKHFVAVIVKVTPKR